MRPAWKSSIVGLALLWSFGSAAWAGLLTREYAFAAGKPIDIREANDQGSRLDAVQFDLPGSGFRGGRQGASLQAQIAVTNTGEVAQRVGVAIALFDDAGRLLGVASGGSNMLAVRPGQHKFYTLDFDHVTAEAHKATKFRISIESPR